MFRQTDRKSAVHRESQRDFREPFRERLRSYDLTDPESKLSYTREVFSYVAVRYDVITRLLSFFRDSRWKQVLIRSLPRADGYPIGRDGDAARAVRCLDLACGTGDISRLLADRYRDGTVEAVDLNPEMLSRARSRAGGPNIHFVQADMNRLPYPDHSFDVVTGGYALRNSPELSTTLSEIVRVLRPGGYAAFLEFSTSHVAPVRKLQLRLLSFWGGIWGWIFHRNSEVYGYIAESLSTFPDYVELPQLMERLGFSHVRQRRLLFGMLALTFARAGREQAHAAR